MATYTEDQLERYFQHINFPREKHPKEEPLKLLTAIQKHHIARVPFDSVALHYSPHRLLSLDPQDLFQKIVVNSRGGYCMEVNTFFGVVLRSLGFTLISAGARVKNERWTHMVNIVTINGAKYLVDVGYGAQEPTRPFPLHAGSTHTGIPPVVGKLEWKNLLQHTDASQRVWVYSARANDDEDWEDLYSFTETEFFPEDFEVMNYYVMTKPQSWFTHRVIAYRAVLEPESGELKGELILNHDVVKRRRGDITEVVETLKTEEHRVEALRKHFFISLNPQEQRAIKGLVSELKG